MWLSQSLMIAETPAPVPATPSPTVRTQAPATAAPATLAPVISTAAPTSPPVTTAGELAEAETLGPQGDLRQSRLLSGGLVMQGSTWAAVLAEVVKGRLKVSNRLSRCVQIEGTAFAVRYSS